MTKPPVRVLLVEDNLTDARLLRESLRDEASFPFSLAHAIRLEEASELLKTDSFDVMLLDLNLPDSTGLDTVAKAQALASYMPIVVLTGADDDELGIEAVRLGAQDYLTKGRVDGRLLTRAVRYALERKRGEDMLKALNETLEQRVAERTAVAETRSRQLRALAVELAQTEERERRRLAEILHDHLQQILVAAKFNVAVLQDTATSSETNRLAQKVDELLDQSLRVSRSLTQELSPPVLYEAGLGPAIEWLSEWMSEKHGIEVRVETDDEADPEEESLRVLLFQVVRELLLNVVKHANTQEAQVRVARLDRDRIQIVVEDAGAGFSDEQASRGFGLFNIRERLDLIGGQLDVASNPDQGTRITVIVPSKVS